MRVAVGSRNPVKVRATERALDGLASDVDPVAVDSGVGEQPWGQAETVAGATNRAERARATGEYDLGVGIEGGVATVDGVDGLFLVMWAAVTNGETVGHGGGPTLRLPERVRARLEDGAELGPVMDDLLGEDDVKHRQGAAGALTAGTIDRESALVHALAGSLAPFVTGYYR